MSPIHPYIHTYIHTVLRIVRTPDYAVGIRYPDAIILEPGVAKLKDLHVLSLCACSRLPFSLWR